MWAKLTSLDNEIEWVNTDHFYRITTFEHETLGRLIHLHGTGIGRQWYPYTEENMKALGLS